MALLPLLLGGAGAYTAGVAANAAAEDVYEQTEKGKSASDAFGSGVLTAGAEVLKGKVSDAKFSVDAMLKAIGIAGDLPAKKLLENQGLTATKESVNFFIDFLADKAGRSPNAEFSLRELVLNAIASGFTGFLGDKTTEIADELDIAWNMFG